MTAFECNPEAKGAPWGTPLDGVPLAPQHGYEM
jgi:hypothetical protein